MTRLRFLAAVLGVASLAACGDKHGPQTITAPAPGARIKFFNFGVGAPNVNFYANADKVTGVLSATGQELPVGTASGSAAAGGFYTVLSPGQYTFTGHVAAVADSNLTIASVAGMLADGKAYSVYLSGPYNTAAKSLDSFMIEDAFPAVIDFSATYVRFVNAISNANPLTLYARGADSTDVVVGSAVSYKSASTFTKLTPGAYNLFARYTGVSTNAIVRNNVSFAAGRVYTVGARGDITVTSTTSASRPQLDNTANR